MRVDFAARALARDEHEPIGFGAQPLNLARQPELLGRNRARRNHAEDAARRRDDRGRSRSGCARPRRTSHIHSVPAWLRSASRLRSGIMVEDQRLDIAFAQDALSVDRTDLAVDANRRTRLRGEIQRRRAARRRDAQQAIDAGRVQRRREARALIAARPDGETSGSTTACRDRCIVDRRSSIVQRRWRMGNRRWRLDAGHRLIGDRRWRFDDRRWTIDAGRRT